MKIAIIGAGVIGVTTAYELSSCNHEVTVFERHSATAEESSFAAAGLLSHYEAAPWMRPSMPWQLTSELWSTDRMVRSHPWSWRDFRWMRQWKRHQKLDIFQRHFEQLLALRQYSDTCFQQFQQQHHLDFDQVKGHLLLLRGAKEQKRAEPALEMLREQGVAMQLLHAEEARLIEPALNPQTELEQAVYFPDDASGNCRQFTQNLKQLCERHGVKFEFGAAVQRISAQGRPQLQVNQTVLSFDAVVVCAGQNSLSLLRPLGVKCTMRPFYHHSITAAIREPLDAPRGSVMDERFKVSISRLGQRVRVSGGACLHQQAGSTKASQQTLYKVLDDWFGGAARTQEHVQTWCGAMPTMADEKPMVGAGPVKGIWLNFGHGPQAWSLAFGSARSIANQLSQQPMDIDLTPFTFDRRT